MYDSGKTKLSEPRKLTTEQRIKMAEEYFQEWFESAKEDERRFELPQKAYVNARYNKKNYNITKEDLEWLAERVKQLQVLTKEVCRKWIESLKAQSGNKVNVVT